MGRHVSVALLALALAACGWHGPTAAQTWPGVKNDDVIIALDKAAYKLVGVSAHQAIPESDGRLRVTLELSNLSALDLPVQVQTVFRDKDGMLTGDETNAAMIVLPGDGSSRYEVVSLTPNPGSYTVSIKTP